MKNLKLMVLFVAFVLCCFAPVFSADVNNGINEQYISETTPAITGKVVDAHIRVMEFVVGTRMTIAQKQIFVKAIADESKNMDEDQLNDLLEVVGLAESLNKLNNTDAEPVRQLLEKDFDATVASLEGQNDLAATQYNKIKENLVKKVVSNSEVSVSRQSVEALAEYLAFIANTKNPIWPNELTIDATAMRVRTGFASYTEDEKNALEDFQLTWYLIRAAWQNADAKHRAEWQKGFDKLGLKPGADVTSANIKAAINIEVYSDMLDYATQMGIEPIEWSNKTTSLIW